MIPVAVVLIVTTAMWLLCSFQGPQGTRRGTRGAVSQNSTACRRPTLRAMRSSPTSDSVDMLGRPVGDHRIVTSAGGSRETSQAWTGGGAVLHGPLPGLPRKEVIQPHLPVRLPCYDFTPVTSPTFDGSLPCGLGHRLRVLLTPVV